MLKYTDEHLKSTALKYPTRSEWAKADSRTFWVAKSRGIMDDCCDHMERSGNVRKQVRRGDGTVYRSIGEAAISNTVVRQSLHHALTHKTLCAGYTWEYVNEETTKMNTVEIDTLILKLYSQGRPLKEIAAAAEKEAVKRGLGGAGRLTPSGVYDLVSRRSIQRLREVQTESPSNFETIIDKVRTLQSKGYSINDLISVVEHHYVSFFANQPFTKRSMKYLLALADKGITTPVHQGNRKTAPLDSVKDYIVGSYNTGKPTREILTWLHRHGYEFKPGVPWTVGTVSAFAIEQGCKPRLEASKPKIDPDSELQLSAVKRMLSSNHSDRDIVQSLRVYLDILE